jgi:hypothetical protein
VTEGLTFQVEATEFQSQSLILPDRKGRLNWFELLEYVHLLAPACEVVLTPGVA